MIRTRIIKVKSVENEEIIMAITMTKIIVTTVIMKIIIIIIKIMRIKIGNCINIYKRHNRMKSVQVKTIYVCLKGKNIQKAMLYWNAKIK